MTTDLTLALRIKAAVDGLKQVEGLLDDLKGVETQSKKPLSDPTREMRSGLERTSSVASDLKRELTSLLSLAALGRLVKGSIDAVRSVESSFRGLEAVANHTGVGIKRAWEEVTRITEDGLLNVADAAKSLQNLLSRGYSLDEAVQTLNRLKDAAAFNRAEHLSLSEAVRTATEGLKNENSVLVDNAGVTKNVSVMWKEYAEQIGKSVTELTLQEKIQAEVNGIMRETVAQTGNAAKAAAGAEGQIAAFDKAAGELSATLGDSLLPAVTKILEWGTKLTNEWLKPFIAYIKVTGVTLAAFTKSVGDIMDGNFDQVKENWRVAREMAAEIKREAQDATITITRNIQDAPNSNQPTETPPPITPPPRDTGRDRELAQIEQSVRALELEAETYGMTREEMALYRLELAGATQAQLDRARAALEAVRSEEEFAAAVKASEEAVKAENAAQQEWLEGQQRYLETVIASVDPTYQLTQELDRLARLMDTFPDHADIIQEAMLRVHERMDEVGQQTDETANQMDQYSIQAARNMQSAFADFLFDPFNEGLDGMLYSFVQTLQRMAAEALSQQILRSFFDGMASSGGGFGEFFATMSAGINHAGGIAGHGPQRSVSPLVFAAAPRYHDGNARQMLGLQPGEVPAIIKDDEEVVTRDNPRHILNQGSASQAPQPLSIAIVDDRKSYENYLASNAGGKTVLMHIQQNAQAVKRLLT